MSLIIFRPPAVEPIEPPIHIRIVITAFEPSESDEGSTVEKPDVVRAEKA